MSNGRAGRGARVEAVHADGAGALVIRRLGRAEYEKTWREMQAFTAGRNADTADELWYVEHPPIYTLGLASRPEHLPRSDIGIPVIKTDRGGQITYHGPGQIVIYTLLDLRRRNLGVRTLVRKLEQAVIDLLRDVGVEACRREDAPGVYIAAAKIAALGLRVRAQGCYHGLSLNADMDLTPFQVIDPCGHSGLAVTQLGDHGFSDPVDVTAGKLLQKLSKEI